MGEAIVDALRAAGCVFAEEEAALLREASADAHDLAARLARRVAGEPLETVVGWTDFDGVRVPAAAGVFVPRQRSALLVEVAAALVRPGDVVLDLCCGAGALGAALVRRVPGVDLWAGDLDPAAVALARRLLPPERVACGDLWDAVPAGLRGRVAVVLCNAPYVPSDAVAGLPREARDHEPARALDGGPDGLALHRRVLDGLAGPAGWLRPDGVLLTECGEAQAPVLLRLAAARGLVGRVHRDPERGAVAVEVRRSAAGIGQTDAR
ncbi:putative protein N(5)-glutamine methyltransferase [Nocardioides sp. TRM66260-LWL]|uniref:putative protein N(5)-glutamine methyltransferase n=1 Tax=Nocardioides sp. TRM66260-LWL TaxID=2874478 RepID=UPI001CC4EA69|nr:putative protein N(5)-glutamine methyltransferase [Nocardioides sp. TRM66260-LWL]MBZ5734751.1 putative protein N(5)-glutamine methyltransferase [Nocardioides sp. TRM66260-LWL]